MSAEHESFCVAGVDGCKAGWFVAIAVSRNRRVGLAPLSLNRRAKPHSTILKRIMVAKTFTDVLSVTQDCRLVCVDIPIGLSDGPTPRQCDVAARRLLRRRASSVFPAPIRPCLSAGSYETACKISFERSGRKLSTQSFALLAKIRQVDDLMTPELQKRVREIHPEVSFWALNNQTPMCHRKTKLIGRKERMKLLGSIFSDLERTIDETRKPKVVAPDDILDALVAAWSAGQAITGKAETLPELPDIDSKGLRMEILCPLS